MKIRKYEMNRRDLEPFIRDVHKKTSYALQYKTPIEYRTQLEFN